MTGKTLRTLLALMPLIMAMAACGKYEKKTNTSTSGTSTLFCDESFENIMEQEIDVFEYIYPNAHVLCRYGSEREAIDSLTNLSIKSIVIPRELTDAEVQRIKNKNRTPRTAKIAVDAVALIVNEENPASYLSTKEIGEILSGETPNWIDINPHYPDKPIIVLFDNDGSSMMNYMRDSLMNGRKFGENAQKTGSIKSLVEAIQRNKYAIGVIGVSWLSPNLKEATTMDDLARDVQSDSIIPNMADIDNAIASAGVKTLGVMKGEDRTAYRPFQQNIYNGTYPLTRSIYMTTISPSGSPGGGFFSFVTGFTGQKLIMKTGILPARMNINVVELVE